MVKTNIQTFSGEVEILSNLHVGNYLTANGTASNVLDITGNVGATFFVGDGGFLSNIATTLNDIVANPGGNTVSNTLVFESGADVTSNTAIVTYANVGISISNTEPTGEFQLSIGSNIFVNTHAANVLTIIGSVGANTFIGDGGFLSNIATTLDDIISNPNGNSVSNTVVFISGQDPIANTAIVTHKDVGISVSNTAPTGEFQFGVGSNLFVNTYSSNVLSIEGNVNAQKMTLGTISVTSAYGLNHVTAQGSATGDTISLSNVTTGLEVTSNITAGGNVTAETVITSANVEVGNRLKFASNVFVDDLRIADLAANLVTYDKTTGELMDSGGLFSNKLAVVSVQPPSALTANATTIAKHGTYTVTTSSLAENSNAWNAFDGDSAVEWTSSPIDGRLYDAADTDGVYDGTSNLFTGNYIQPGVSSAGEWLAIEFPYKTTLRHMKLTPPATRQRYPASANVYATNDSLTWTEVAQWGDVDPVTSSNVQTVVVNATESFKKYAMVVTKANGGADNVALAKWDLFAESFSIDGGQISMAQQPTTGGETMMEQSGPHGRGAAVLKKFPEIVFEDGKFEYNHSTNTYVRAGYTVTASSQATDPKNAANLYNGQFPTLIDNDDGWQSKNNTYDVNGDATPVDTLSGITGATSSRDGSYTTLELPHKIKLSYIQIHTRNSVDHGTPVHPKQVYVYGSYDGSSWTEVGSHLFTSVPSSVIWQRIDINSTTPYNYFALQVESILPYESTAVNRVYILDLEWYGYEELATQGDTSVDTTFTSIMNTPQTTGANVYVDGSLGETFTNRVVGPTVSNTHTTYVSAEKYWELSGNVESNVTLEANTFLSGDAPHSLSMWFNSSNLEANVSNTCVFSVSDQEHLNSQNLDLQSNTWHNLTYAYQGEGGSKVTYLDGRKVAEDQAGDTFGEYPPFAMTGYSQGGYVVSASSEYSGLGRVAWEAFDDNVTSVDSTWTSADIGTANRKYDSSNGGAARVPPDVDAAALTIIDGISTYGEWVQLEFPYKMNLSSILLYSATHSSDQNRWPKDATICASNDDFTWTSIGSWVDELYPGTSTSTFKGKHYILDNTKAFKYVRIVITKVHETTLAQLQNVGFYGHRENDLVRLPDPTNVLKYPHVVMTGPAQRGYVASASSHYGLLQQYAGWKAFDAITDDPDGWVSANASYQSSGTTRLPISHSTGSVGIDNLSGIDSTSSGGDTARNGSWLKIKLPHKLKLSQMKLFRRQSVQRIVQGFVYGSNDNITFYQISNNLSGISNIGTYSNTDPLIIIPTDTTTAYKYFVVQVTASSTNHANIGNLEFYGTEEASSTPIQIGGGNIDKVANFRVYDKFVGEDQALEIWDAQKDTFRGVKNSVTLHKGRLGIGTTEPEGRLAVLDEPHNLEEFPPSAMTGYKNYFEGHGEFCASASSYYSSSLKPFNVFNKITTSGTSPWISSGDPDTFDTSTGLASTAESFEGTNGPWIKLELPYNVKPKKVQLFMRTTSESSSARRPKSGIVYGRKDGMYHQITNFDFGTDKDIPLEELNLNTRDYYSEFVFQITSMYLTGASTDAVAIKGINYFGTREQGQSVLHDGQLTLTKNLNVPRIGPALDADDTPRRDRLVVEYNTSTNPTSEGVVRDTSGRGNDGFMRFGATYNATKKSLEFPLNPATSSMSGNRDSIETGPILDGTKLVKGYSVSTWFRADSQGAWEQVWALGKTGLGKHEGLWLSGSATISIHTDAGGGMNYYYPCTSGGYWKHVTFVRKGTTSSNHDVYVDGVKVTASSTANGTAVQAFEKDSNLVLGENISRTHYGLDGAISNFKLYDTALTPSEVKTLYDMGRCDEGHHVVNFSKTRVGIGLGDGEAPRSALDVRDLIYAESSSVRTFTGQHICFPDESMEKGLIVSAKKNKFVKLNGLATGKSAITIDESLPIVSLSNVAQDKACFGVVSKMEESNAAYRTEITGGLVSESVKIAGDNRAIVNSVGEGAIWVVDTNGPLESGDYITTSNVVGYGQKQDDDVLHNYTVAKITMDCDFTGSNVAVQTIKREETGLRTIMEDTWNQLVDYDRSSNTETQYSNTLAPSAYTDQPGYTPRKVTTIVDYTDGSNIVSIAEWSNLESNIQNTYQSNTFTEIVDYTKFVNLSEWSNLTTDVQNTYSEAEITTYYQIQRGENVLDENGQLQFEDKTGATEAPYERRFLDASGAQTDSANAVHIAAFVGCTYHCG